MSDNKSSYSVEDMIEAAQANSPSQSGKPNETREVITQADGTKVVRVRKRKRKSSSNSDLLSSQVSSKSQYTKIIIISLIAAFITCLVLGGIFLFKIGYYNSPDQITKIEESLGQRLNSSVNIQGYRLGPTSTQLNSIVIDSGSAELPATSLKLSGLKLPHQPETLLFKQLNGQDSEAKQATLIIDYQQSSSQPLSPSDKVTTSYMPYKHRDLSIRDVSVTLGAATDKSAITLTEATAKLLHRSSDNFLQVLLYGGKLANMPGLPSALDTAILVDAADKIKIQTCKLNNGGHGHIDITGALTKSRHSDQSLECEFVDIRLETLNKFLGDVIEAKVNAPDGTLELLPDKSDYRLSTTLDCNNSGVMIKGFKFLESMGSLLNNLEYPEIMFNDRKRMNLIMNKKGYRFWDLNLEKKATLALQGEFTINYDGTTEGLLHVGVPTSQIKKAYPQVNLNSLKVARGYTWFDVSLSGSTNEPNDNFESQFKSSVDALR